MVFTFDKPYFFTYASSLLINTSVHLIHFLKFYMSDAAPVARDVKIMKTRCCS